MALEAFKEWGSDPSTLVLFPGYCVRGTLGKERGCPPDARPLTPSPTHEVDVRSAAVSAPRGLEPSSPGRLPGCAVGPAFERAETARPFVRGVRVSAQVARRHRRAAPLPQRLRGRAGPLACALRRGRGQCDARACDVDQGALPPLASPGMSSLRLTWPDVPWRGPTPRFASPRLAPPRCTPTRSTAAGARSRRPPT